MSADDENRNGELEPVLAGEDASALAAGERDLGPDEPGGSEPPPEPPSPEFLADAGTADIGMPDEQAADELVGGDMDAAEWAALAAPIPAEDPVMPAAPAGPDTPGIDGADDAEYEEFEARLERLEAIQHQVVLAARAHEAARVKRKVVASTTGAGAAGFIPLLLQLVDALKLSPQVAATVTTVVAALGALVAGYLTPDRPPVLPSAPGSVDTSPLDVEPIAPLPAPPSSLRRSARQRPAAQHRPSGHA
ncbi:MAG TPA: hypothetical protein VLK59_08500 [Solirubrobacteraceae bacterium]|jgi:hypothetical protein|nr:hypothetical protein [Solirubrobacteraceae bacterium]